MILNFFQIFPYFKITDQKTTLYTHTRVYIKRNVDKFVAVGQFLKSAIEYNNVTEVDLFNESRLLRSLGLSACVWPCHGHILFKIFN